jgi:hypothetical protein
MHEPLKVKLIGNRGNKKLPRFYQKYFVLNRTKIASFLEGYSRIIHKTEISQEAIDQIVRMLDDLMDIQESHYFVVNLDEKEGQEAMVKYWELKGYPRDEIISCLPKEIKKQGGQE